MYLRAHPHCQTLRHVSQPLKTAGRSAFPNATPIPLALHVGRKDILRATALRQKTLEDLQKLLWAFVTGANQTLLPLLVPRAQLTCRCGSRKHSLSKCRAAVDPEKPLPFASCFVCNGAGHLSSMCPHNVDKGIYPNGGCCKLCGEVTHLAKNCGLRKDGTRQLVHELSGLWC